MVLRGPAWSCVVLRGPASYACAVAAWCLVLYCAILYMYGCNNAKYVCMYVEKRKRMEERRDIKILREDLND